MARRLIAGDPRQERATQQRLTSRIANAQARAIQRAIRNAMNGAADRFGDEGFLAVDQVVNEQRPAIERTVRGMYSAAWDTLGGRILRAAKSVHGAAWVRKQDPDDEHAEALRQFIAQYAASRVDMVQGTTTDQIRRIIQNAQEAGEGVEGVAKRIRESSSSMSQVRSQVIARTEVHNAGQAAQDSAARAGGAAQRKEWFASLDDRTRDDRYSHVDADGEIVGMNETFEQTGESMRYPGDPRGSSGNVIMCRCGVGYFVD